MEVQENEALKQPKHLQRWLFYATAVFFLAWNLLSWSFPFFWDNILNSRIAQWYLETGFERLVPPEQLDAGHPPFFSLYIAGLWSLFGKSLAVAHAGMLPFLLGTVWAWGRICKQVLPPDYAGWGMLILIVEPTYLAQSSMVSPDLALVCFFLLGVVAILENRRWLLALAALGMCAATFRGILMVPGLFLLQWAWIRFRWRRIWASLPPYLPAAIAAAAWLLHHQAVQGWLFSPPPETYGAHREVLGAAGILRNGGIAIWRFLDYGRVFLFVFLAVALLVGRKRLLAHDRLLCTGAFFLVPALWLLLLMLPFSNPIGHRYFALSFLALGLVVLVAVDLLETKWRRWFVPGILALGLLGGHFWVYPDRIAQGWDASLAHLRYFPLQARMDDELKDLVEGKGPICSEFPLLAKTEWTRLRTVDRPQVYAKEEIGWENCSCILASNISNGFSDAEWLEMEDPGKWERIKAWENGPVFVRLLARKP